MSTNYFESVSSVKEIKRLYRLLAFDFHPDRKPLSERDHYNQLMTVINAQYHAALKSANGEKSTNKETGKEHTYSYNAYAEQLIIDMLARLLVYDFPAHITVSIVGLWLWVEGVTSDDKETIAHLKSCKMEVDGKKYWFFPNQKRASTWQCNLSGFRSRYSKATNDQVKSYYGAREVKRSEETAIR